MKGFKTFLMKGNVVDLAVAVVIGAAFGGVVSSFVKDLLTPLIAAIVGKPDFSGLSFSINGSQFLYGNFINAVVSFLLIGAAVYYVVVVPTGRLGLRKATLRPCPECLTDIPGEARRCAHCGMEVGAVVLRTGT